MARPLGTGRFGQEGGDSDSPGSDITPLVLDAQRDLQNVGSDGEGRIPIGVLPGFQGQRVGTHTFPDDASVAGLPYQISYTETFGARYFEGDEIGIGASLESISEMTYDLMRAGYLDFDDIRNPSIWGAEQQAAMWDVMIDANSTGNTVNQIIAGGQVWFAEQLRRQQIASSRGRGGSGGRAAPTFRISNSDDLREVFRAAIRSETGGVFLDAGQINDMVTAYQAVEKAVQQKALGGGTIEAAPSAEAFALTELDQRDPQGAEANRFAQMASILEQSIVGG